MYYIYIYKYYIYINITERGVVSAKKRNFGDI